MTPPTPPLRLTLPPLPPLGLDARSAAIVMRSVRSVANNGRTVMVTIHQPSIEIFEAFDILFLLQVGGGRGGGWGGGGGRCWWRGGGWGGATTGSEGQEE